MVFSKEVANRIIICIILVTVAIFGSYQYSIRDYVKVEAQISGKGIEIGNKTRNTNTYIYYEYVVDGKPAGGKVLTVFQSAYHVGDTEMIRVNPAKPDKIASKEGQRALFFIIALCGFMLINNIRQMRHDAKG